MMKIIAFLCVILGFLVFPPVTRAADPLYRMLNADEVQAFKQDQDALILAQLKDKKEGSFLVQVIKTITGKVNSKMIEVEMFEYAYTHRMPSINDYAVMSLKHISNSNYKNAWGIFKADNGDYTQLHLVEAHSNSSNADLAAIEWFIKTEGKERDFSFNGDQAYVHRSNGDTFQIHPKLKNQNLLDSKNSNQTNLLLVILSILFLIGILLIYSNRFKNN